MSGPQKKSIDAGDNFFRARRLELGLTLHQVATAIGTQGPSIAQWEREVCCPRLDWLDQLVAVYQVSRQRMLEEIATLNARIVARRRLTGPRPSQTPIARRTPAAAGAARTQTARN